MSNMNERRIHQDSHGIYVKTGGYVMRPVVSERYHNERECLEGSTQYVAGQKVKAEHVGGSGLGLVGDEYWFVHGSYIDNECQQISSEECWEVK